MTTFYDCNCKCVKAKFSQQVSRMCVNLIKLQAHEYNIVIFIFYGDAHNYMLFDSKNASIPEIVNIHKRFFVCEPDRFDSLSNTISV